MIDRRRPRRRIEIYFVLYLVALVLLLPDRTDNNENVVSSLPNLRMDLQPERVRMELRLIRDSVGGIRLRSLDSVNVIRYTGDISDLRITARIEEVETGQVMTIEPGETTTRLFELVHQPERQAVMFRWRPDVSMSSPRTFRVTVNGSAAPLGSGGANSADIDKIPPGLRLNGSAQFVLTTSIENEGPSRLIATQTIYDTGRIASLSSSSSDLGTFWIDVTRERILTLPTREWTNRINIGGADVSRDLSGMPVVQVNMAGTDIDKSFDTAQRAFVLRGRAPRSGSYTVSVFAKRRDGQTAEASFLVVSIPLPMMDVPSVVYPGIEYVIDPKLPDLEDVKAILRTEDKEIVSVRSGTMRFTAQTNDTGSVYILERLVDGQRAGSPTTIRVKSFPAPEITDVRNIGSGNRKKVIVKFYGDPNRDRPFLEVVEGNAQPPRKQYGNRHAADPNEKPTVAWLEEFLVDRKDNLKPFVFKLQARDQRGWTSRVWTEGE